MESTSEKVKIGITNELRVRLWADAYNNALAAAVDAVGNLSAAVEFAKHAADTAFGDLEIFSTGA